MHDSVRRNTPTLPTALAMRLAPVKRSVLALAVVAMLGGCATETTDSRRSIGALPTAEYESVKRMRDEIVLESKKMAESRDALYKEISVSRARAAPVVIAPVVDVLEQELISVSMMSASISDLLIAFSDQAGLNLIVDPNVLAITKRADMYLKKVSPREFINEVMRAFDVTGDIRGNTLRVNLLDERIFALDMLNATMSMDVSSGGNVFGANSSGGSGSANALRGNVLLSGGSGAKTDPYDQIEASVKRILGDDSAKRATNVTVGGGANTPGVAASNALVVDDAPHERVASIFTLNRNSGTMYVKARPSQLRSIEKLLDRTQKILRRQVQIEAQLIDVQLNDGFEFGVDWKLLRQHAAAGFGVVPASLDGASSALGQSGLGDLAARTLTLPAQLLGSQAGPSLGVGYQEGKFSAVLTALRSFGAIKILSNPSVQVRNGTPALLTVGTNARFVSKSSVTLNVPGGGASTTSSDVQTDSVFSGVMVGVIPFIRDDGQVELVVHPMQTEVETKSLALVDIGANNKITLPVVNYKGMTTTLNIASGDTVMIGGLIDRRVSNDDRGAPVASDIPLLGKLFGNQRASHSSRELVMVLRVNVL